MGDFNCPQLNGFFASSQCTDGGADVVLGSGTGRTNAAIILNAMEFANLRQYNAVSYSADRFCILDLVFGNAQSLNFGVRAASSGLVEPYEYHPPLIISIDLEPVLESVNPFQLNYRRANFTAINQGLVRYNYRTYCAILIPTKQRTIPIVSSTASLIS